MTIRYLSVFCFMCEIGARAALTRPNIFLTVEPSPRRQEHITDYGRGKGLYDWEFGVRRARTISAQPEITPRGSGKGHLAHGKLKSGGYVRVTTPSVSRRYQ